MDKIKSKMYDQYFSFGYSWKPTCGIWQYVFNTKKKKWETLMIGAFPEDEISIQLNGKHLKLSKQVSLFDIIKVIEKEKELGKGHVYVVC